MKILAVAGDAGGARAMVPVLRALQRRGAAVTCRAHAAAPSVWGPEGLGPTPPGDPAEVAAFDRLLVGTSVGSAPWELAYVREARRRGVRSVAVLDFWVNYWERFTDPEGNRVLPDAIAVMDARASAEMGALGFPPAALVATGHPGFEEALAFREPALRRAVRAKTRAALGLEERSLVVLFASQPISQLWTREQLGFLEDEVLRDVFHALGRLATAQRPIVVVVKRHPREATRPAALPAAPPHVTVLDDPPALRGDHHLAGPLASDLTAGMNSVLLLEAALAGLEVVSYQPHLRIPDPLPSNATGLTRGVVRPLDLQPALAEALAGRGRAAPPPPIEPGAAERIASLLVQPTQESPR